MLKLERKELDMEMLEKVLENDNLERAYKQVYSNKGASGVDNVTVYELKDYMDKHMEEIKEPEKNWVNQHQILVVIFFFVTFTIVILILVTKNGKRKCDCSQIARCRRFRQRFCYLF